MVDCCVFSDSLENGWDMTQLKEEEFEEFCVYIVHDLACEKVCPNRAQASMPRNLTLKPSLTQHDNVRGYFLYHSFFLAFFITFHLFSVNRNLSPVWEIFFICNTFLLIGAKHL